MVAIDYGKERCSLWGDGVYCFLKYKSSPLSFKKNDFLGYTDSNIAEFSLRLGLILNNTKIELYMPYKLIIPLGLIAIYLLISIIKNKRGNSSKRKFIDECNQYSKKEIDFFKGRPNNSVKEYKEFYADVEDVTSETRKN